jgi:hypothetical protein
MNETDGMAMVAVPRRVGMVPDRRQSRKAGLLSAALATIATIAAYLIWLGWHATKDVAPSGSQAGPYEHWQVAGLAVTLAVLTVGIGLSGHRWASLAIPATLTMIWSWDAATIPHSGPNFWPIGAFLIAIGSTATMPTAAFVAAALAANALATSRSDQRLANTPIVKMTAPALPARGGHPHRDNI